MHLYSLENGCFSYDHRSLFSALSFSLSAEERILLKGPSGVGKSTLLRLVYGMEKWDRGTESRSGRVHYQAQDDFLLPWKSILENLSFTLPTHSSFFPLLTTCGLGDAAHKKPGELSQGMRQRVAFLRTLLSGADILLFDEPFSNLDWEMEQILHGLLDDMQRKTGAAVVIATHSAESELALNGMVWELTGEEEICLAL